MSYDGREGQRFIGQAYLHRHGNPDSVPGILQYCRSHRHFPKYRAAASFYQLRKQLSYQYMFGDGAGAQRRTSKRNKTLLIQGGL